MSDQERPRSPAPKPGSWIFGSASRPGSQRRPAAQSSTSNAPRARGTRPGTSESAPRAKDRRRSGASGTSSQDRERPAVGSMGRLIKYRKEPPRLLSEFDLTSGANALIMMRRVVFLDENGKVDTDGTKALLAWAAERRLGQDPELLRRAVARRDAALAALRRRGQTVVRLRLRPEWRMAVGLGNRANPHEIGLSLHGTYGWPIIPGSSLKGLTAAWAAKDGADAETLERIFGSPRPERAGTEAARLGTVRFLDALPTGEPVPVTADVVTPHVQPYYDSANDDRTPEITPPAEYHKPIPSFFLAVSGGEFVVDLVGPAEDVRQVARWCAEALDEMGIGAKNSAGYGYAAAFWEKND